MTEFPVDIHFNSVGEFEAVYRLVREEVLLFDAFTGTIIASNNSFKENNFGQDSIFNIKDQFTFPFEEDGSFKQLKPEIDDKTSHLFFEVSSVLLANKPVKMLFVINQNRLGLMEDRLLLEQAEKKALLNEVYHRVKNNLNIIVSLLSLQINRVSEPYTRHLLLESKSRIYTLSLLQQKLYSSSRISEIKAGNYLQSLAQSVISTFKPSGKEIKLNMEIEEEWLNIDTLMPLGLITHELVTNSVLHAFLNQEPAVVNIDFRKVNPDQYLLRVSDNGMGLPENKLPEDSSTLGFQLIKSLLKQLKAEWKVDSILNSGTCFSIAFKELR